MRRSRRRELTAAAERLCPLVRGLVIDAPGGEDYARSLQARFGLPVTPPAAGADAQYHVVVRGDTLWEIARRYGVALERVVELNPSIRNPNLIYPGQKVRLT